MEPYNTETGKWEPLYLQPCRVYYQDFYIWEKLTTLEVGDLYCMVNGIASSAEEKTTAPGQDWVAHHTLFFNDDTL